MFPLVMAAGEPAPHFTVEQIESVIWMANKYLDPKTRDAVPTQWK